MNVPSGFRLALAALAVALTACAGEPIGCPAPHTGEPDLRVPASELAFGQVGFLPGAAISATLNLAEFNAGTDVLRVHGWELQATSEGSSADEVEVLPPAGWDGGIDLAPGESVQVTVRVPSEVDPSRELIGELEFEANSATTPHVRRVVLDGRG